MKHHKLRACCVITVRYQNKLWRGVLVLCIGTCVLTAPAPAFFWSTLSLCYGFKIFLNIAFDKLSMLIIVSICTCIISQLFEITAPSKNIPPYIVS